MIKFDYSHPFNIVLASRASIILKKQYWYVTKDVDVVINSDIGKVEFTVPAGYLTDGSSIPRIFWSLFPAWDNTMNAVIVHDYLCNYPKVKLDGKIAMLTRNMVDNLFLESLKDEGIPKLKYTIMYAAVRAYAKTTGHQPGISQLKSDIEEEIRQNIHKGYM